MELRDRNRLKIAGGMKWTDAEIVSIINNLNTIYKYLYNQFKGTLAI